MDFSLIDVMYAAVYVSMFLRSGTLLQCLVNRQTRVSFNYLVSVFNPLNMLVGNSMTCFDSNLSSKTLHRRFSR